MKNPNGLIMNYHRTRSMESITMLNALHRIGLAIAESANVEELAANFLRSIADELDAQGGSAFALRGDELSLVDALDPGHQRGLIRLSDTADSAMGRVIKAREPIILDFDQRPTAIRGSGYSGYSDSTFIGIPGIDSHGEIQFIVFLHNRLEGQFHEQDLVFARGAVGICNMILADLKQNGLRPLRLTALDQQALECVPDSIDAAGGRWDYHDLFNTSPAALWELDVSGVGEMLTAVDSTTTAEFSTYLDQDPGFMKRAIDSIIVLRANARSQSMFEYDAEHGCIELFTTVFGIELPDVRRFFAQLISWIFESGVRLEANVTAVTANGRALKTRVGCFIPTEHSRRNSIFMSIVEARSRDQSSLNEDVDEALELLHVAAEHRGIANKLREFAQLIDISSDAILVRDLTNHIVFWNASAEKRYGWLAAEVIGKDANKLLYQPQYAHEPAAAVSAALEHGVWTGELHHIDRSGKELLSGTTLMLERDENGRPHSILSVSTDNTELKSMEAQLHRAQRLESLGALASGITHDLNNVLAPILMGINMISAETIDSDSLATLAIMKKSAQRAVSIVKQVLGFARGMDGKRGPIHLKHIIKETEDILINTLPKSIDVRSSTPGDLWLVDADATQLHQVLMNMAVNARDAMEQGGTLTITAENLVLDSRGSTVHADARPGRYVVLSVSDTGSGMPQEVVQKIFEPFYTTKPFGKGTGLGLSTARSIVDGHHGFITVRSERGKGTSFRVHIPAVDGTDTRDSNDGFSAMPAGRGELILFVDDEPELCKVVTHLLENNSYRVITAADGTEALSMFAGRSAEIDLVITDMMMPYLDGPATIRALRKMSQETKIIAMSGVPVEYPAQNFDGKEVKTFIAKPFTPEVLLNEIRRTLDAEA